jgi:hypothetical protein
MHLPSLLHNVSGFGLALSVVLALYHWSRAAEHLASGESWWVPLVNVTRGDPTRFRDAGRRHLRLSKIYGTLVLRFAFARWASS